MASTKTALRLIFAMVLIDVIAGSIIWPVWPEFVKGYQHPEILLAIGTAIFIGIQLITAPLMGKYSDVRGRKPVFIFGAIGTFLSYLFLLPRNPMAYFGNRTADGLTNGVYATVRSAITDVSSKEKLMSNIGMQSTIASVGFILGPVTAAVVLLLFDLEGNEAVTGLLITGILISGLNIVLTFLYKETLPQKSTFKKGELRKITLDALNVVSNYRRLKEFDAERPGLLRVVGLNFCLYLAIGYYYHLITFISLGDLQFSAKDISYFFLFFGVIFAIIGYVFFKYLVDQVKPRTFIPWMSFLGMLTLVGYAFVGESTWLLYLMVVIDSLTISLVPGVIDGLIAQYTSEEDRGEIFGIIQAMNGLASFVTAVIFGGLSAISLELPFYWFALCLVPLLFAKQLLKEGEGGKKG